MLFFNGIFNNSVQISSNEDSVFTSALLLCGVSSCVQLFFKRSIYNLYIIHTIANNKCFFFKLPFVYVHVLTCLGVISSFHRNNITSTASEYHLWRFDQGRVNSRISCVNVLIVWNNEERFTTSGNGPSHTWTAFPRESTFKSMTVNTTHAYDRIQWHNEAD